MAGILPEGHVMTVLANAHLHMADANPSVLLFYSEPRQDSEVR